MRYSGKNHKITFADGLLLLLLIGLSLYSFVFIREALPQGSTARIEVEGRPVYSLPLNQDKTVSVAGPLGTTVVEIRGGHVRVADSPCRNGLCKHQGWTSRGAIVCLPNRVVITVTSPPEKAPGKTPDKAPGKTLDGISG